MGQTIKAGTGMCDILLDEQKLMEEISNIDLTQDDFINVTDNNIETLLEGDSYEEEDYYCNDENFEMSVF